MQTSRLKLASFALALGLFGCDELENSSFDLSCGGTACSWDLDEGHTKQVATWSKHDKGLELVDTPTTISQLVGHSESCGVWVEVLGKIDEDAKFTVAIDADDDGNVDDMVSIPKLDWDKLRVHMTFEAESS